MFPRSTEFPREHWNKLAEEAEARADGMRDADAQRAMRVLAMMYNQMAVRAQTRAGQVRERDVNPSQGANH